MTTLDIAPTEHATLLAADALTGSDFEDDLQIACAVTSFLDYIVTRVPKGLSSLANPRRDPCRLPCAIAGALGNAPPGRARSVR